MKRKGGPTDSAEVAHNKKADKDHALIFLEQTMQEINTGGP